MKPNIAALLLLLFVVGSLDAQKSKNLGHVPGQVIVKFRAQASADPSFRVSMNGAAVSTGLKSVDKINVESGARRIEPLIPDETRSMVLKAAAAAGELRRKACVEDKHGLLRTFVLSMTGDVSRAVALYAADPAVEYAGFNHIVEADATPDDPMYPGTTGQWHLPHIQAPDAWDESTGSSDIMMGFIDSGADLLHPDLMGNLYQGYDFVRVDTNALKSAGYTLFAGEDYTTADDTPMDFEGHGTHVAGIIGAVANNDTGIAGTMWNCKLVPLRAGFAVIKPGGSGMVEILTEADIAFAMYWSEGWGVDVVNMSISGPDELPAVEDAIDEAHDTWGMVFVASSGDEKRSQNVRYPAGYPNVIAVTGSMRDDVLDTLTNYGSVLSVAAPSPVLSTWYDVSDVDMNGLIHDYEYMRGSSQSAALASGVIGLILSVRADLIRSDPEEVRNILTSSADKVGGYDYDYDQNHPGKSLELGYGRINAYAALETALSRARLGKIQSISSMKDKSRITSLLNYPNPFNPTTTVEFSTPTEGHVSLRVFDLLGRMVLTLVDENRKAGTYKVPFDGSHLSSGVYFMRLSVPGKTVNHKILLQK